MREERKRPGDVVSGNQLDGEVLIYCDRSEHLEYDLKREK
jgi:hypothetical protein